MWNTDPEELQIWRNYGYKWSTVSYMWILDCLEDSWPQPTHCSRVNCTLTIVDQLPCKSGLAKNNHRAFTSPSNQDSCCSTQSKPHGLSCGCRTHRGDTGPPLLTVLPSDLYTELCVWAMCMMDFTKYTTLARQLLRGMSNGSAWTVLICLFHKWGK